MDPARMFRESLTSRPELENSQGHERTPAATRSWSASPPLKTDIAVSVTEISSEARQEKAKGLAASDSGRRAIHQRALVCRLGDSRPAASRDNEIPDQIMPLGAPT